MRITRLHDHCDNCAELETRLKPGKSHVYRDLFLISFLILFFELACIRWFGSTVVYLTFFTNIVLLATFLGMSVGCLAASGRRDWTRAVMPTVAAVGRDGLWRLVSVYSCSPLSD